VTYGGLDFETTLQVIEEPQELTAVEFEAITADKEKRHLVGFQCELLFQVEFQNLGLHTSSEHGRFDLSLYSPFWMVNNTGMPLTYLVSRANVFPHRSFDRLLGVFCCRFSLQSAISFR
jgi:hypothetical protein